MANPIFYLILLLFSLFLSVLPPFLHSSLTGLYFFHAFFQLLASASLLFLIDTLIRNHLIRSIFVVFTFFLFLLEVTHLTLARLLDSSVNYVFQFLFGGGFANFIPAWQALNLNGWMTSFIFLALFTLPVLALFLYRLTNQKIQIPPLVPFFCLSIGSICELTLPPLPIKVKSLPWGITAFQNEPEKFLLPSFLISHRSETETLQKLSEKNIKTQSKLPNIYLFIVETFRKDFVTKLSAPTVFEFGEKNIYPKTCHANANSTFPSWFSILHSNFPHHWTSMRDEWKKGSIPLKIFKDFGYELFTYASQDLRYFGLDELLFGKNRVLINQAFEAKHNESWGKDAACIDQFEKDLKTENRFHIFFLDSTHSEYSTPPDFPQFFKPSVERIDYLLIDPNNIEPLKNRYRNSIRYIDSLFEKFLKILESKNLLEEAIIVVTGDHGEEFFEDGALFHGTHLNEAQTSVPIIYQLPGMHFNQASDDSTHLDILPTILHTLSGIEDFSDLFDGESIFKKNRRPHRFAIHHNCANPPNEFWIGNATNHCHFRIVKTNKKESLLEITSGEMSSEFLKNLFYKRAIKDLVQIDSSSNKAFLGSP